MNKKSASFLLFISLLFVNSANVSGQEVNPYMHDVNIEEQIIEWPHESEPKENEGIKNGGLLKAASAVQLNSAEEYEYSVHSPLDSTLVAMYAYTYNSAGLKLKDTKSVYDNTTSLWYESEVTDYIYNASDQLEFKITKQRAGSNYTLEYHSRVEYSYDTNGNTTVVAYFNHDGIGWIGTNKYEYSFNANGRQLSRSSSVWENGAWRYRYQYQYDYDQWGYRILNSQSWWSSSQNSLIPSGKDEFVFDANGVRLQSWYYRDWDVTIDDWSSKIHYEYHYNAEGDWIKSDKYERNNTSWVKIREGVPYYSNGNRTLIEWDDFSNGQRTNPSSKSLFSRLSNGAVGLSHSLVYDQVTDSWQENDRDEYAYDINGNTILSVDYNWDSQNINWVGSIKNVYAYDALGYQTLDSYYRWDATNKAFYEDTRREYIFDEQGREISDISYGWDQNAQALRGYSNQSKVYNTDNTLFYETTNSWFADISDWVQYKRIFYTYDGQATAAPTQVEESLEYKYTVSGDVLKFKTNSPLAGEFTLELYSVDGKLLKKEVFFNPSGEVNVADLSSGIYLVRNSHGSENVRKIKID